MLSEILVRDLGKSGLEIQIRGPLDGGWDLELTLGKIARESTKFKK